MNDEWDAQVEVRFTRGSKITVPKIVVDRLGLKPGDILKIAIKVLKRKD